MRYLAQFRKTGAAVYVSHLDLMRTMQRALRRANVPMCYSNGFNPHPILSFAMASPVGMASHAEYMDVKVEDGADALEITRALIAALPEGLSIVRSRMAEDDYPALMSRVALCDAAITFLNVPDAEEKWKAFYAQPEVLTEKHSNKGVRTVDIKPMILTAGMRGDVLSVRLRAGSAANLSPTLLAQSFCAYCGGDAQFRCLQRALWAGDETHPVDLLELDKEVTA